MSFKLQLQESLQNLLQSPQQFNQISRTTIIQLAKLHSHNRLLPSDYVSYIIEELHATKPFETRQSSLKFAFYYNMVRHIMLANFHQLKDNKIFAVVAMIYAQKLSDFYHELQSQQKSFVILKHVAQISIINEITLKYVQRSKIFFPEYVKALKLSIEKLQHAITSNIRHSSKVTSEIEKYTTIDGIIQLAFSKDSQKRQLIFLLLDLLNFVLRQASSFFTANAYKKDLLKLNQIQSLIVLIQQLQQKLPKELSEQLIIPAEFKKYQYKQGDQNNQNEPIYLQESIHVRELTPRFYNEEEATVNKLLRKKKNKLQKKMQLQLRQTTNQRLMERKVVDDVKKDKVQRQVKKQLFVMQKQTQQAKKYHKQLKKVKTIKKDSKTGKGGNKGKPTKMGRKGKK